MARKSNKTAHVLNLIAGHEAPKEAAETPAAPVTPGKRTSIPSAPISSQNIAVIDTTEEDPVSDLIQEKLSDEFKEPVLPPDSETPSITEHELQTAAELESKTPQQLVLQNDSETQTSAEPKQQPASEPQTNTQTEPLTVTNLQADTESDSQADSELKSQTSQHPVLQNDSETQTDANPEPLPITEPQTSSKAEPQSVTNLQADTESKTQADSEAETKTVPKAEPDFVRINIMERIVEDKIIYFMRQFDVCTCDRCVNDTIALTLSGLLPKYVVTSPAAVDPLLSFYTNKYISDVTVEATKACMIIKDNPRH